MDILDDMEVSKLSAKVFFKVNYSFKMCILLVCMLFGNQILDLASASAKLLMFNQDTCWVLVLVNVFVRRPATHIQCSICLIVRYFVNTFKFLGINIFIIMS